MAANGIVPEDLLSNKYGHRIHFWDLRARRNVQTIDLGAIGTSLEAEGFEAGYLYRYWGKPHP